MTDEQKKVFAGWFDKTGMYAQKNGKVRGASNQIIPVSKIRAKWEALKGYLDGYFATDEDDIQGFIDEKVAELYPETDNTDTSPEKLTMQNFMLLWDDTFELRLVSNTPIIFRKGGLYNEQISSG